MEILQLPLPEQASRLDTRSIPGRIPQRFDEQRGVLQIILAAHAFKEVRRQGGEALDEQKELRRIRNSMLKVTGAIALRVGAVMQDAGLGGYIHRQSWDTKTPESTVGKVCTNVDKGNFTEVKDIHRGITELANGAAPEVVAPLLAAALTASGTIARVERFNSPRTAEPIRDWSRKVVGSYLHDDGEYYSFENQLHDPYGFAKYQESNPTYHNAGRELARIAAEERWLGALAAHARSVLGSSFNYDEAR